MSQSDKAKKLADQERDKAWNDFKLSFQNADLSKFKVKIEIKVINEVTAEVFFIEGPGSLQSVFE